MFMGRCAGFLASHPGYPLTAYSCADLDFSIKNVQTFSQEKGDHALNGNDSVKVPSIIFCSPKCKSVKEWAGE